MTDNHPAESSVSAIKLNVKTLDSQIHSFYVDKNMPVSVFKGKIVSEVGLPVVQQRLIFRGKVLKDEHLLSEYHVENEDTLHLVARQPAQSQPSSGTSSSHTNAVNENDTTAGGPRNRVGQISHSVVLGTFNVGEQGEGGGVPDIGRVIGSMLNSLVIVGQPTPTGTSNTQSSTSSNDPGQASQVEGTESTHPNVAGQNQAGNQTQFRNAFARQQFNPMPQAMQTQIPLTGSTLHSPIPDSLNTLSEFMNHMELVLAQRQTGNQPTSSPNVELPSNTRGMPTPEALSTVLRQAQRLLNDQAVVALSHFADQLEHGSASTEYNTRSQIQTESAQLGLTIQHLGALFLELGRTILTLRMGAAPTESFVNAGPAVYISPLGPNPIMVQPFPLQTSSLFSSAIPSNLGNLGPNGAGNGPRHLNIHIHAGTALVPISSVAGARVSNREGTNAGRNNLGPSPVPPVSNPIGAAVPTVDATSGVGVPVSQSPSDAASISVAVADLSSRVRNLLSNTRGENQTQSGESENSMTQSSSIGAVASDLGYNQLSGTSSSDSLGTNVLLPQMVDQKTKSHQIGNNENEVGVSNLTDVSSCTIESHTSSTEEISRKLPNVSDDAETSSEKLEKPESAKAVPLGLGLGGLQPKARIRQPKPQVKNSNSESSSAVTSHTPASNENSATNRGGQGLNNQFDPASIMSQVIQSPALNGLLSGVSEQTGVGSPNMLRNMLEQFSQNPLMMNTVNQIAQQVDNQDIGNMFSGLGGGQGGGGMDLSRMIQQMMPIVSRAFGDGGPNLRESFPAVEAAPQPHDQTSQIDLQQAAQSIAQQNPPSDIFRVVVENVGRAYGDVNSVGDLMGELCSDEDLASEFMQMLKRDVHRRLEDSP